jgi:hypothetical protein
MELFHGVAQQVKVNHPLGIMVQNEMAAIPPLGYMMRHIHHNYAR